MSDKFLTRSHRRYTRIAPGSIYEVNVQTIIERNMSSLFPEYFGKIYEPYYRTAAGDVKPDLVLIRYDYKGWALVEVEIEGHSAQAHILPQLSKLTHVISNEATRDFFIENFPDSHSPEDIELALRQKPEVILVIHGSSESFQTGLKTLGVSSFDVEIHTFPPDDYILNVLDREENYFYTGLTCSRSSNYATRFIWSLPKIEQLDLAKMDGKIEINILSSTAIWGIRPTKSDYLLRQPSDIQFLQGVTKMAVYRHRNFNSLKFVPIEERQ